MHSESKSSKNLLWWFDPGPIVIRTPSKAAHHLETHGACKLSADFQRKRRDQDWSMKGSAKPSVLFSGQKLFRVEGRFTPDKQLDRVKVVYYVDRGSPSPSVGHKVLTGTNISRSDQLNSTSRFKKAGSFTNRGKFSQDLLKEKRVFLDRTLSQ